MSETVLELKNLKKNYGRFTALYNLNLSIQKGEIIGLVGPNGAGKTTTLKLIAGLRSPTSGEILIQNKNGHLQNIRKNSKNLIDMGFLIDIPTLYNTTPNTLLKYIANITNYSKKTIKQRIDELLKSFSLYKWKFRKIKKFSKGMIQKLAFVVAIIHEPKLIILDEPQSGLDPDARIKIRHYLRTLKKQGRTILISSHLLTELSEICDKILLINKGKLVGYDTIDNLERKFRTKTIYCEIMETISKNQIKDLLKKIEKRIAPYLGSNNHNENRGNLIEFDYDLKTFKIPYDGIESSRSKILQILTTQFDKYFTITSFSEAKTYQLENLYSQLNNPNYE